MVQKWSNSQHFRLERNSNPSQALKTKPFLPNPPFILQLWSLKLPVSFLPLRLASKVTRKKFLELCLPFLCMVAKIGHLHLLKKLRNFAPLIMENSWENQHKKLPSHTPNHHNRKWKTARFPIVRDNFSFSFLPNFVLSFSGPFWAAFKLIFHTNVFA